MKHYLRMIRTKIILLGSLTKTIQISSGVLLFFLAFFLTISPGSAESDYYEVTAKSGLILRDSASQKGGRVTLLPEGMRVKQIETSDKSETIAGKTGIWVKVKLLEEEGWVFNSYLKKVKNNDSVSTYIDYLSSLKKGELTSVKNAKDKFLETFKPESTDAENAFRIYRSFSISQMSALLTDNLNNQLMKDYGIADSKISRKLNSHGYVVEYCEGYAGLGENFDYYLNVLKKYTFQLKEFFTLMKKVGGMYACDAGIGISWEEIRNRIGLIETFLKMHSSFSERTDLEYILQGYINSYVNGEDNTPVCPTYGDTTQKHYIIEDVKKSYQKFLKHNKNSKYYSFMSELYKKYEKSNFECKEDIAKFRTGFFESK